MMRLWGASWRISRVISIGALLLLCGGGAVVGFLVGKQTNNVTINNTIPATTGAIESKDKETNAKVQPPAEQVETITAPLRNEIAKLQQELTNTKSKLAELQSQQNLPQMPPNTSFLRLNLQIRA